jgi:hypothetical protein
MSRVVDSLHMLERLVIARSPQSDEAISSRLLRSARNDSIEIHGGLLTSTTAANSVGAARGPHLLQAYGTGVGPGTGATPQISDAQGY